MPNIAAVLKDEIRRLARREINQQIGKTRKAAVQYRKDIATLKRQLGEQEKEIVRLKRDVRQQQGEEPATDDPLEGTRFSSRSVKAQRRRLGLSAADYGRLVGVAGLTVYNWEHNKARPRQAQLAALVAIRSIGKREALKRLAELDASAAKKPPRRKAKQ
jgi:DNA-binding transcriptional regulator YiaG